MSQTFVRETTQPTLGSPSAADDYAASPLRLLVLSDGNATTYSVAGSTLLIGRSDEADVQIPNPSLSREHARLTFAEQIVVEDCGSSNGTFLHGQRLQPGEQVSLTVGESVDLGTCATIVLQQRKQPQEIRRLWPHGYFEARLEEECLRARRLKTVFTVFRVQVMSDQSEHELNEALGAVFRAYDVVAMYGPQEYELLFVGVSHENAHLMRTRLQSALKNRQIEARVGFACYPEGGREAAVLVEHAGMAALGTPQNQDGRSYGQIAESNSGAMEHVYELVDKVAPGTISVLLQGETGVGKEVLARRIHQASDRAKQPLVSINCGAVSPTLLESELFGHEKGAFTGATTAKPGLFAAAHGGTVFLDEVGEMPLAVQIKLLRVLEERKVRPVGGITDRTVDIRIVSATNRDLEEEVRLGHFRSDLYFRLAGVTLSVPPLRERRNEIRALAEVFLAEAAKQRDVSPVPELSDKACDVLEQYWWPGNIRELRNIVERAALLSHGSNIEPQHLPTDKMGTCIAYTKPRTERSDPSRGPATVAAQPGTPIPTMPVAHPIRAKMVRKGPATSPQVGAGDETSDSVEQPQPPAAGTSQADSLRTAVADVERQRIVAALESHGGNQTRAAAALGISRGTLLSRMDRFSIPRPRKPGGR